MKDYDRFYQRETLGRLYGGSRATQREFLVLDIETAQINERRAALVLKAHDEDGAEAQKRGADGLNPSRERERRLKQERRRLELAAEAARLETRNLEHQLEDFDIETTFDEQLLAGNQQGEDAFKTALRAGYGSAKIPAADYNAGLGRIAERDPDPPGAQVAADPN